VGSLDHVHTFRAAPKNAFLDRRRARNSCRERLRWKYRCLGPCCSADEYVERDDVSVWTNSDLNFPGAVWVYHCQKQNEKNLRVPIRSSKVLGRDQSGNTIFEGQYSSTSRAGTWIFYWPSGAKREAVLYDGSGVVVSHDYFQEDGSKLLLKQEILDSLSRTARGNSASAYDVMLGEARLRFSVRAPEMPDAMFNRAHIDLILLCDDTPEQTFEIELLYDFFREREIKLAYNAVSSRSVIFITAPIYSDSHDEAEFYVFYLQLGSCSPGSGVRICGASVSAHKKIARVENDVIQVASARERDDRVTYDLLTLGMRLARNPIVWCRWRKIMHDLYGPPDLR
jgi:hypothetical protein